MEIRIENWEIVAGDADPYMAPEIIPLCLRGNAYGHPRFPDGQFVTTTPIAESKGNWCRTESGSEYILGQPEPRYEEWYAKKHGKQLNIKSPFPSN